MAANPQGENVPKNGAKEGEALDHMEIRKFANRFFFWYTIQNMIRAHGPWYGVPPGWKGEFL